ncbi:MAG: hypothetical protein PHV08_00220 [Sulfurovaceae bacterium]|nr:hypothetical protein [Sulfurovaceae bacterium]
MNKIFFILISVAVMISANEYQAGQSIKPIILNDQFGATHKIARIPRTIIITFEKEPSDILNEYLSKQSEGYLEQNNAIYIADISQMPAFVTKSFALPKMKEYKYKVLLITDENEGALYPYQEGQITIIKMENDRIRSISFTDKSSQLNEMIEK